MKQLQSVIDSIDFEERQCRFCYENEDAPKLIDSTEKSVINKLVAPCLCKGSLKYIHQRCLKKWVNQKLDNLRSKCQICLHVYEMRKKLRCLRDIFRKLYRLFCKNGTLILKDLLLLASVLTFLGGAMIFLYVHQDRESDVLNIVVIGFAQRLIGFLIKILLERVHKVVRAANNILYKMEFVNKEQDKDKEAKNLLFIMRGKSSNQIERSINNCPFNRGSKLQQVTDQVIAWHTPIEK